MFSEFSTLVVCIQHNVEHFGSGTFASCIVVSQPCRLELVLSRFSQGRFHLTCPHKLDEKRHEFDGRGTHTTGRDAQHEAYKQCKRDINTSDNRDTTGEKRHITGEERHITGETMHNMGEERHTNTEAQKAHTCVPDTDGLAH